MTDQFKVKSLFNICNISTSILFILLLFYFPIVLLNLVFTFNNLSTEDVPYYYTCTDNGNLPCGLVNTFLAPNRLGYTWWMLSFDITLPALLFIPYITILHIEYSKKNELVGLFFIYCLPIGIIATLQIYKFVTFNCIFIFICQWGQVCRNFYSNDSDSDSNPQEPNWIFIFQFVFNAIFIIYSLVYSFYYLNINKMQKNYIDKLHNKSE